VSASESDLAQCLADSCTEYGFHGRLLLSRVGVNPAPAYHRYPPPASSGRVVVIPNGITTDRAGCLSQKSPPKHGITTEILVWACCSFIFSFAVCEHNVESDRLHSLAAVEGGDAGGSFVTGQQTSSRSPSGMLRLRGHDPN
jgi:hypothetical protein